MPQTRFGDRRHETRSSYIARIDWNIKDALEALHNAVGMRDWAGVRKYTAQIEKLERARVRAEGTGFKRTRRGWQTHLSAGSTYGRGRLP